MSVTRMDIMKDVVKYLDSNSYSPVEKISKGIGYNGLTVDSALEELRIDGLVNGVGGEGSIVRYYINKERVRELKPVLDAIIAGKITVDTVGDSELEELIRYGIVNRASKVESGEIRLVPYIDKYKVNQLRTILGSVQTKKNNCFSI